MQTVPYTHYVFIIHFAPNSYNGLEHRNSTAIQFDARTFADR
jgi:predicted metalloprotease with PDZ domain